jgi:hypothetical protein
VASPSNDDKDFLSRLVSLVGPFPEWIVETAEALGMNVFEVLKLLLEGRLPAVVIRHPKVNAENALAAGTAMLGLASLARDFAPRWEALGNSLVQVGEGDDGASLAETP